MGRAFVVLHKDVSSDPQNPSKKLGLRAHWGEERGLRAQCSEKQADSWSPRDSQSSQCEDKAQQETLFLNNQISKQAGQQ